MFQAIKRLFGQQQVMSAQIHIPVDGGAPIVPIIDRRTLPPDHPRYSARPVKPYLRPDLDRIFPSAEDAACAG